MTYSAADPYTVDDLAGMPDDGRRYELLDGELLVSPAPGRLHQRAVVRLCGLLDDACPPELEVLVAPFGVRQGDKTELETDVLVARVADLNPRHLPVAPLLAVEVLSPSTTMVDLQ
jgi:Uma2 family endonuclease